MSVRRERRVDTIEGEVRGVTVRWDQVLVAGHVVEMTLSYRIAEAEQVYSCVPGTPPIDHATLTAHEGG